MNTLLHLVVVAATAKVSNSVADAADVGTARKKITHRQCLGVTLGKKKKKVGRTAFPIYNSHQ